MMKMNRSLLPIKAHFFFFFAAMGPLLPQMNVYAKQLGISAFIMGIVTSVLPILWALAKPAIGFLVDYFHRQRKFVFMSLIFLMSCSYFCIYFLPEPPRDNLFKTLNLTAFHKFENYNAVNHPWISIKPCDNDIVCTNDTNLFKASCGWICKSQLAPFYNNESINTGDGEDAWNFWVNRSDVNIGEDHLSVIYYNISKDPVLCEDLNMNSYIQEDNTDDVVKCVFKEDCKYLSCAFLDNNNKEVNLTMNVNNLDSLNEYYNIYATITFWGFVIFMCAGTVAYNVGNCIGDAVCLDILGPENGMKYGFQRAWGTAGYGLTALISGFIVDYVSGDKQHKDFTPAFIFMAAFTLIDLYFCRKLKLPRMSRPVNAGTTLMKLFKQPAIFIFVIFAIVVGIFDSFLIYYMFWFMEDVAMDSNNYSNIKFLEGLTIAVESFGGEILFFALSGSILKRIGFQNTLTVGLFCYVIRLILISVITQPWHIVLVEMFFQGPSYALCYSTIVGYAAHVAPPGLSATVQGILAGMDDGVGFVFGSLLGGILYGLYGGRNAFRIMGVIALVFSVIHAILNLTVPQYKRKIKESDVNNKINKDIELVEKPFSPNVPIEYIDESININIGNTKNEDNENILLRNNEDID